MVVEAIFIGILVGFIYYELFGFTPGGVVVPGYIALYFFEPGRIAATLMVSFLTLGVLALLSNWMFLFGRRAFMAAVIVGFLLRWGVDVAVTSLQDVGIELRVIGYIIPGLIAHEFRRQGIVHTLCALAIVCAGVKLILLLRFGA